MDGKELYEFQKTWEDEHITIRFLGFDPTSGQARLAIDEHHPKVGFYFIWFTFNSGDETRIDYDGGNPNRDMRPVVSTTHRNDVPKGLRAKRVRD